MLTTKTNTAPQPLVATIAIKTRMLLLSSLLLTSPSLLAQSQIEKAEAAQKKGHNSQAIAHYQRAVDQGSSNHLAEFQLVRLYLNEKRLADALRLLDKLADKHSDNAEYLQLQGDLARQLNDWESAKGWYQQALDANPNSNAAVLHLKLGQALQQLGEDTAADKTFAEYARLEGIPTSSMNPDQSGKKQ